MGGARARGAPGHGTALVEVHVTTHAICERVRSEHPYDTPEVVALPMVDIDARYAAWLPASVRAPGHPRPASASEETT